MSALPPLLLVFLGPWIAAGGVVDLPGVDVLSSGYDAASWSQKGNSKYRIFDLSAPGQEIHVPSIGKSFTAPQITSVVTDGPQCLRIEDSCEGIASSFSSYLHTHFESTSFDVGIKTGNFSLGLFYHKDIQEVYEAITANGQAVGTSESWWGMYQITLPPPFLLAGKLDPTFQAAKVALTKIGTPKTDQDQEIYNQVCCGPASFGTHYIGSVIVGARARMTTFVNNSFHKSYSEKRVEEEISIGFQWKKLSAMGSHNATDFEKKLMQDYKNSSHSRFEWQPDSPDIHSSKTPWLAWQDKAKTAPEVVNMSVSSLAHLFYDQVAVMNHMQKTIDYYILNSQAPALKDLGPSVVAENEEGHEVPASLRDPAPGLDVVGCGFHAPTLTSRMCLFDRSQAGSTWSNPFYPNISYDVPIGFMATDTPESTLLNGSVILQSIDDYVEHSYWTEHHHSSGFLGFGSKTEDKTTEEYYRKFYAHRYYLALSMRQISWYTLQLLEFPLPPFSSTFEAALKALPDTYDPANGTTSVLFSQFFEAFGTSVVSKADMGGIVWAESWFESCMSHMYSDKCITDTVTRGWWIFDKHDHSQTCDKRITQDFEKYSSRHYEMLGGTAKVNISEWDKWALTVKDDPRPVKMEVVPIYYLLPDSSSIKTALEQATSAFLNEAAIKQQQTISELERIRAPPASICSKTMALPPSDPETMDTKTDPHQVLCPIVGYHGAYCPPQDQVVSVPQVPQDNSALNLPRGVGLTIDISNGDLKLPAWQFVFSASSATWTDPSTKQVFKVPDGVQFNTDVAAENVPVTHVFKTEDELVSVWENGYEKGSWLGGEFGNSKSVADLFAKFFSKQQSTSINQHPAALYRLTLKSGWQTHLNSFANGALKSLPVTYDANVYSRFFDTWGTHVANDTLVGGMAEQQVTMKDCVFQSPFLSGGLTEAQLEKYLTMDLAKAPPQDSFYTSRRQMSLDHKIGGNPEITDEAAWIASLSKDPALLKIYSYEDWASVAAASGIVSAHVVDNLRNGITDRLAAANQQRTSDKAIAAKKRIAELQGPRPVVAVVAHGRRGGIAPIEEAGHSLTLKGVADCPSGLNDQTSTARCSTGVNIHSWNSHEITTPLRYERNAQGEMRSIRCFDLDGAGNCIDHVGPWVQNGCSMQPFADGKNRDFHAPVPASTVVAAVCADCALISAGFPQDSTLKCACPGYADMASSESCYDTFSAGMPNYKQCDPRWKCFPYAGQPHLSTCSTTACHDGGPANQTNNICGSGCGVTSTAMVLSYYRHALTPPDIAKYFISQGYRNDLQNISGATCDGVSHVAICSAATHWGMACQESSSFSDVDDWLHDGPVIAHVRHRRWTKSASCKFTKAGHYIVITGRNETQGWYTISDPNSCEIERTHGTPSEIQDECELVGFVRIYDNSVSRMLVI